MHGGLERMHAISTNYIPSPSSPLHSTPPPLTHTHTSSSPSNPGVREYKAWGVKVIESNDNIVGPEIESDIWEGEQFTVRAEAWM
jgi:hypothetical protein